MKMKTLITFFSLINLIIALKNVSNETKHSVHNDKVIFPTYLTAEPPVPLTRIGTKRKSNCVKNFCEQLDDYPNRDINRALESTKKFDQFFDSDDIRPTFEITDRGQFDGDDTEPEETLCDVEIRSILPKIGINTNKTERIIVNNEQYKQLIVTETCKENGKCKYGSVFPNGVETSCKQKYMRKRLISLSDDKKAMFDTFDIPCCCVCTVRRKQDLN